MNLDNIDKTRNSSSKPQREGMTERRNTETNRYLDKNVDI